MLKEGEKAVDFCLPDKDEKNYSLEDFKGKWIVLYFYPRDNTKGCTKEALDFTKLNEEFKKLNTVIIGISKDSPKSHKRFVEKHNLGILLLSDEEHKIMEKIWCLGKEKNIWKGIYRNYPFNFFDFSRKNNKKNMEKCKSKKTRRRSFEYFEKNSGKMKIIVTVKNF